MRSRLEFLAVWASWYAGIHILQVSLHPILDKTTYHLINKERLSLMKKVRLWSEILLRVLLLVLRQGIRPSGILPMLAKPSQSKHIELWSKIQEKRSPRALDWTKCGHWHYILHPNVAVGKLAKTIRFCVGYWKPLHCINQITYSVCFSWRLDVTGCSAGECKQRPSHWWSSFGGAS
jgi:hypothetical protein